MPSESKINRYFELAKKASEFSDFKQYHLGSVLIYQGKTLSIGWNTNKSAPVQKQYNRLNGYDVNSSCAKNSLHSEIACLSKVKYYEVDFSQCSLYIYRQHKNGVRGIAKPCPACRQYIKDMGIKNIYYTTEDGWAHEKIES